MSAPKTCAKCKFWKRNGSSGYGVCTRFPPEWTASDSFETTNPKNWNQPITKEDATCGEFK